MRVNTDVYPVFNQFILSSAMLSIIFIQLFSEFKILPWIDLVEE